MRFIRQVYTDRAHRLRPHGAQEGFAMNLTISGQNNVVYHNETSETHRLTIVVSGQANVQVKTGSGSQVSQKGVAKSGGAVSLQVPAAHRVEIDVTAQAPIDIEFLGIR